jgi:plastocyanin
MAKSLILDFIRILPRETDFLERKVGSRGEVFYDRTNNALRLYDGVAVGGYELVKNDLTNIDGDVFKQKAEDSGIVANTTVSADPPEGPRSGELWFDIDTAQLYLYYNDGDTAQWVQPASIATGSGGGGGNAFRTITISGQSDVVADSATDTLTLVAGTNVTLTTDADTDTITISATGSGGASNSFTNIAVSGQNTVVADSTTDTLTLVAGTGIQLTTNQDTDSVTITSTVSGGATLLTALTDVSTAALTVDKIYKPAVAMLTVTNSGTSAYLFNSHYSGSNPSLYALSGTTIAFNLNVTGHPFELQSAVGDPYNVGLTHVAVDGTVSTGSNAQGKTSGTLYWDILRTVAGTFRYQCQVHGAMVGQIIVKDIANV